MRSVGILIALLLEGCAARGLPIVGGDGGGGSMVDLGGPRVDFGHPTPDFGVPADFAIGPDLASRDMSNSAARCLTGGSVIYFDGDPGDYIHPGAEMIQVSQWSRIASADVDTFWYEANPPPGTWWMLGFSSRKLGAPLAVGRYDNATRYPFEANGHPGLSISGDGRGCNNLSGWFEIESVAANADGTDYTELTATFEQHCENQPPALRGCVHFER